MWRASEDAAQVVKDFAQVAKCFTDVPAGFLQLVKDAFHAVISKDATALSSVIDRTTTLTATIKGDVSDAQSAIDLLQADMKAFLADLS